MRTPIIKTKLPALIVLSSICALGALADTSSFIQPFPLSDVHLARDSDFSAGEALNHEYLLILDPDNLLYNFRITAGLLAPGQSYGGWEGSTVEVRGQFLGHYLSALAFAYRSTGSEVFHQRAAAIISGLEECQVAHGDGYLSAFPKSHFDRLEALQPVWAPYYVIHKICQGLLDQHQLAMQPTTLRVLTSMASYFCDRSEDVVRKYGMDHWHQILETEFGGMNDVMYQLYMETKDSGWARCAVLFDKPAWYNPLVAGQDVLSGLHANTHLAQVNGFASRFDATGDESAALAVMNFFATVTKRHSFSTGGSNWFERWGDAESLGNAINNSDAAANTQESCTTYNILKIARSLFRWSGGPELADFYERAVLNGVLGIQRTGSHDHDHDHSTAHSHLPQLPTASITPPSPIERDAISISNAVHAQHPRPTDPRVVSWPNDPAPGLLAFTNLTTMTTAQNDEAGQPGQYIYYMPLGHEGGKGDNPRAWTHGWGDRFNTFWCCYGTAVESFSKLADSIYFWYDPKDPSRRKNEENSSNEADLSNKEETLVVPGLDSHPPALFINQFVSSTLNWRDLGVTLKQKADLYGERVPPSEAKSAKEGVSRSENDKNSENVAKSKVEISITPCPHTRSSTSNCKNHSSSDTKGDTAKFYLHWRVPSWVDAEREVGLKLNGRSLDVAALPRASNGDGAFFQMGAAAPARASRLKGFNPPDFGDGADYVILGPDWKDGDTIEAEMPMRISTEDLNDARPELQVLKAITMGPFHLAGITEGDREIDIDPSEIQKAVTYPDEGDEATLVSLSMWKEEEERFKGERETLARSIQAHSEAGAPVKLARSTGEAQRSVLQPSSRGNRGVLGEMRMEYAPLRGGSRAQAMAATFKIVPAVLGVPAASPSRYQSEQSSEQAAASRQFFSLESMAWPGLYLTLDAATSSFMLRSPHSSPAEHAEAFIFSSQNLFLESKTSEEGNSESVFEANRPNSGIFRAPIEPHSLVPGTKEAPRISLVPPAAPRYPKGARLLTGKTKKYLLVPLGQLIDEHYTAYFEFASVAPSVRLEGPRQAEGAAVA